MGKALYYPSIPVMTSVLGTIFLEDFFSDTHQIFNKTIVCLDPVKQFV